MKTFLSHEALVVAYWRKLASSIGVAYKNQGRSLARHATRALTTRRSRSHRRETARGVPARQTAH